MIAPRDVPMRGGPEFLLASMLYAAAQAQAYLDSTPSHFPAVILFPFAHMSSTHVGTYSLDVVHHEYIVCAIQACGPQWGLRRQYWACSA
jgi:hypothetical protein